MSVIQRNPVIPPATSPNDPRYYEARNLEAELRRTFQICHECRMCVGYCGSFPELFNRIDKAIDSGAAEGAETIDNADIKAVGDQCWQCKLCYIKCPYTADEGASELLDFPRLMSRERAARSQREGIPLVDKILGEPQLIGQIGAVTAPLSNLITRSQILRKVQEKVTGISAEFPLPTFAKETFSAWFQGHTPAAGAGELGEVVLFATCYGEYNTPAVAQAAVLVLEHNGYAVRYSGSGVDAKDEMFTCCGLPNIDGGDVAGATAKIEHNTALLLPHVRAGRKIVVPGPSCGMMIKKEWHEYVGRSREAEVKEVAASTLDLMEFLVTLGKEKKLKREFPKSLGTVAYHAACHLRAQKVGFPGMRVLNAVQDTEVRMVEECSAVDGTWGMKAEHYETGRKYAGKLTRGINDAEADIVVSDCSLAALRIGKENGVHVIHPIEALAQAYGLIPKTSSQIPA